MNTNAIIFIWFIYINRYYFNIIKLFILIIPPILRTPIFRINLRTFG